MGRLASISGWSAGTITEPEGWRWPTVGLVDRWEGPGSSCSELDLEVRADSKGEAEGMVVEAAVVGEGMGWVAELWGMALVEAVGPFWLGLLGSITVGIEVIFI